MLKHVASVLAILVLASTAMAQIGDPTDIYAMSDAHSELYQYDRMSPWNYVPGNYPGALPNPWNPVFSNSAQLASNFPYLGAVAGSTPDFFIGGFTSLVKVSSSTGAQLQVVAGGTRLGPAKAPNDNVVVGGPTGVEEYDSNTGGFVRTVVAVGDGYNLHAFFGNSMYVANWAGGSGFGIKRYNFITGNSIGPDIAVPFAPQEIGFGPDNALYATALYEGAAFAGLWRYDDVNDVWSRVIDTSTIVPFGGPHGFTYDPNNFDIYMAFNTGEILRYDVAFNYQNTIDALPTKLTDILFTRRVPEPGTLSLLGLAGLALLRRVRR